MSRTPSHFRIAIRSAVLAVALPASLAPAARAGGVVITYTRAASMALASAGVTQVQRGELATPYVSAGQPPLQAAANDPLGQGGAFTMVTLSLDETAGFVGGSQLTASSSGNGRTTSQYGAVGDFTIAGSASSYTSIWGGTGGHPNLELDASLVNLDTGNAIYQYTTIPASFVVTSGTLPVGNYEWRVDATCAATGAMGAGFSNTLSIPDLAHSARATGGPQSQVVPTHSPGLAAQAANLTLTVTAAGDAPITYRWRRNGVPIANGGVFANATTASLAITGFTSTWNGLYDCLVMNARDTVACEPAMIEADQVTSAPVVTHEPRDGALDPRLATLEVGAASSGAMTYQWFHGTTPLADGDQLSGATIQGAQTDRLTIANPRAGNAGTYHCEITNAAGTTLSRTATRTTPTAAVAAVDAEAAGLHVAPNPARSAARLTYTLAREGDVDLAIFDLGGRRVVRLEDGHRAPGAHETRWDLRDSDGRAVPPGLYLARMVTDAGVRVRRVLVTK